MIRGRVEAARERQRARFAAGIESHSRRSDSRRGDGGNDKFHAASVVCNADMRVAELRQFCKLGAAGESLVRAAMGQMNLSARGYHRVLKLTSATARSRT